MEATGKMQEYEHLGGPHGLRKIEVLKISTVEGEGTEESIARVVDWYFDPETYALLWYSDPSIKPRCLIQEPVRVWHTALIRIIRELDPGLNIHAKLHDVIWDGQASRQGASND